MKLEKYEHELAVDYEAMAKRLEHENGELKHVIECQNAKNCELSLKLQDVNEQLKSCETELARLRAQMDIVYLIFGRK